MPTLAPPDTPHDTFAPFDLGRLLRTVFELRGGERFGVFTDLDDPQRGAGLAFLEDPKLPIQRHAHQTFYEGLRKLDGPAAPGRVEFYVYRTTGGSNLDLPDTVVTPTGETRLLRDVLKGLDVVLYVGRYSATAPITALAKEMGFRGATLHGVNEVILATGLSVDYLQVSARAERLRRAVEGADEVRLEFGIGGKTHALRLDLAGQAAQKSHGLVRTLGDIANLPAGEVYFVPRSAEGRFPRKFEDGTLALFDVKGGGVTGVAATLSGNPATVAAFLARIAEDPNAAQITELGLGTQSLPFAGADIQDEKIIGTMHVATGRSDHLGGHLSSKSFNNPRNAVHEDILFSPNKTPEVALRAVMRRGGAEETLVEGYRPAAYFAALL